MKTYYKPLAIIGLMIALLVYTNKKNNSAMSSTAGAPAARTGSPGDFGLTCAISGCHFQTPTSQSGLITSNIPASGYVPGTTYTLSATITDALRVKFGFEISPQNPAGQMRGTLQTTNSNTQLINGTSGRVYITHTAIGTSGPSGSRTWTFNWIAPAAGSGPVTFYGAFNTTNNQSNNTGDIITLSQLTVSEASTVGTNDMFVYGTLKLFPNPASDNMMINGHFLEGKKLETSVINLSGQVMLANEVEAGDHSISVRDLAEGVYFLKIKADDNVYFSKFIKTDK